MADAEAAKEPPPLPTQAPDDPDYQKRTNTLAGVTVVLACKHGSLLLQP